MDLDPAVAAAAGKPQEGFGHYLRDVTYGAMDGVITTLAVVAGAEGASLGVVAAIALGLANLLADGFSMGASNYLGLKAELEQTGASVAAEQPLRHGAATVAAFVVAGGIPLLAFMAPPPWRMPVAILLGALLLAATGAARARFVRSSVLRCAAETVIIGAVAMGVAFGIGRLVHGLLSQG